MSCTDIQCVFGTAYAISVPIFGMDACTETTRAKRITIMVEGDPAENPFLSLALVGAMAECTSGAGCCLRVHQLATGYTAADQNCAVRGAADISDMVMAVGFAFTDGVKEVSACHKNTKFGIIDVTADDAGGFDNVAGVTFKENEAGFLVGIIAGQVSVSKKLHVVAGAKIPPVQRYATGFEAGVKGVCSACSVDVTYTGVFDNADNLGPMAAQAAMAEGADVIFGVGGFTGSQAIKYASSSAGK
mmetsp:Transcript_71150/g.148398  ORF Transcript_71150/g.148398 Transcript_71150/m.148398 type:complete len:245 (-) Transcript_71150:157-891(-)